MMTSLLQVSIQTTAVVYIIAIMIANSLVGHGDMLDGLIVCDEVSVWQPGLFPGYDIHWNHVDQPGMEPEREPISDENKEESRVQALLFPSPDQIELPLESDLIAAGRPKEVRR